MMKRVLFVVTTAFLALAFAAGGPVQATQTTITQQDCDDAWDDAQASSSCGKHSLTAVNPSDPSGGSPYCSLTAYCAEIEYGACWISTGVHNSVQEPPAKLDDLVNCSGTLAVTNCAAVSGGSIIRVCED